MATKDMYREELEEFERERNEELQQQLTVEDLVTMYEDVGGES